MRQHIFFAQQVGKRLNGLVDDRGIGNNVDHAIHVPRDGVFECKGQGCKCFAAAGGNGQCIEPLLPRLPALHTGAQSRIALLGNEGRLLHAEKALRLSSHAFEQIRRRCSTVARRLCPVHKSLCVLKVRVHQAGVEHSRVKCVLQQVIRRQPRGRLRGSHRDFPHPDRVRCA